MTDDAERERVRAQLVEAGLLTPGGLAVSDPHEVSLALDMLKQASASGLTSPTVAEVEEELNSVKARLVAMKGQLATESQRARNAETLLRDVLETRAAGDAERKQLEGELARVTASRERLERQVNDLVDHENQLLRFMDRLQEVEVGLRSDIHELRTRVSDLEADRAIKEAAKAREERQSLQRGIRRRRMLARGIWVGTALAIAAAVWQGLPYGVLGWLGFGSACVIAAASGVAIQFGLQRGAEVLAFGLAIVDPLIAVVLWLYPRR